MKKKLLLIASLCITVLGAYAQRSYTFNAVALNVDGLPEKVSGVSINSGGPLSDGTKTLSSQIAQKDWGFVGLSEDFNFHTELMSSISHLFTSGTHRGTVTGTSNDTDGLGLLCSNRFSFDNESWIPWTESDGSISDLIAGKISNSDYDNGADELINKGYRYYKITIVSGCDIDVYVLHMDAASRQADIEARESQLKQLATAVKTNTNNNKRPVIILGDTNCRYTREKLKELLIDEINKDSRFTIKDAWVEHMWGGKYPTYGAGAMMTGDYGMQKGEIVDKIFYINTTESNLKLTSNSYLHDESVTVSDHKPVVVNFTLTDPNGTPNSESDWTVEGGSADKDNIITGSKVESGKTYFLKNVGSGTYLKSGATWGTQAAEGSAGMPITFNLSNGKYELRTTLKMHQNESEMGYVSSSDANPYMDANSGSWTLNVVYGDDNKGYQYQLLNNNNDALAYTGDAGHAVTCVAQDATNNNQKWVLLTEDDIREQMTSATTEAPYDITPLLKAAYFDKNNTENNTTNWGNEFSSYSIGGVEGGATTDYEYCAVLNSTPNAVTIIQEISNLPKGNYTLTGQGFYRNELGSKGFIGSYSYSNTTMDAIVSVGGKSATLAQNNNTANGTALDNANGPAALFKGGNYNFTLSPTLSSNSSSLTVQVSKPETKDYTSGSGFSKKYYTYRNWVCIDNFKLVYTGDGSDGGTYDPNLEFRNALADYINSTAEKVKKLNTAGQAAYDISTVIHRYDNDMVTSETDVTVLKAMVDNAYANAYEAHKAADVKNVVDQMAQNGGDITKAIINPSFETGDLNGWTVGGAWDLGAKETSNNTYATEGSDANYLFNAYSGEHGHTTPVKQTIKGIPNGLYELKAMMTSHGATEAVDANNPKTQANRVYLIGNSYHTSIAAERNNKFEEATLYFLVEDGSATIGAVGGNKGGGADFIHYWPWEGCYFKADNFRLKYICDVPHGRLKLALDEAEEANLDAYGKDALDISKYQTMYNNKSLTSDGTTEAAAVRSALQTATKAQRTAGADMTWAITNPSFETGDYTGWSTTVGWDTGVKPQENGTYTIAGTDGRYLFNTWNNDGNATNSGVNAAITQTITGIPNGKYKVTAMVATDANNSINLTANSKTTNIAASTNGASSGVFPEVECEVTQNKLEIQVAGKNNCWYKCDDFRLTLLMPNELILSEGDKIVPQIENMTYDKITVERTIKPNTWSTFVVPFDMAIPEGWKVKALTESELKNDNITLTFNDAENGIKAGVPYMVRVSEAVSEITVENKQLSTTPNNTTTDHVEFVGTYTKRYVPEGAFFISNNKFYRSAAENSNNINAFRAYFTTTTNAKALSYRTDDETDITEEIAEEVTVVAIYNLQGVRLDDMQEGINILKMSNGSTIKVMIK